MLFAKQVYFLLGSFTQPAFHNLQLKHCIFTATQLQSLQNNEKIFIVTQ